MKSTIFWDITLCSPLRVNPCLVATCFHAGFLLGLFFDPDSGGDMFLWNISWLSTDYTVLYPRRQYSSNWKMLCPLWIFLQAQEIFKIFSDGGTGIRACCLVQAITLLSTDSIDGTYLKEKASHTAAHLGMDNFSASNGCNPHFSLCYIIFISLILHFPSLYIYFW
jgi:hypothetical protein